MSSPYSIAFRTRCPICGQKFPAGFSALHYGKTHPPYAKWAGRWEFFLYGSVLLAVLVLAFIYLISPPLLSKGYLQAGIMGYVAASLVAWASNPLRAERRFRREWRESHTTDGRSSAETGAA